MGLAEQLLVGARFERKNVLFTTDVAGFGSVQIAPSYALLSIQSTSDVRLRLYDNESSRDNANEISRAFTNTAVSNSIALIADISMSAGTYTMDPIVYAVSSDITQPYTYYRVEPTSPQTTIVINYYPIESNDVQIEPNSAYYIPNRRFLPPITGSFTPGINNEIASGSVISGSIPATYLLVSMSLDNPTHIARLRLYSRNASIYDLVEKNRAFSTEPSKSVELIFDALISGSEPIYFSPKIIGSNMDNVTSNLLTMKGNRSALAGKNEMYYMLQNMDMNTSAEISASVFVYSLED